MAAAEAGDRPVVLLFFRYFNPHYEASGPTQSIRRLIAALGHRFRFRVVSIAMPGEPPGRWGETFGVERIAVPSGPAGWPQLRRLVATTPHDLALHNSFFDPDMTIAVLVMRKLGLVPRRPTIVAPRGELNAGALDLKSPKKRAYLRAARLLGLTDRVHVQATDAKEEAAIRAALPHVGSILTAPNIRAVEPLPPHEPRAPGEPVRIAFLSRIDPMKNLDLALLLLERSSVEARFDIVGPTYEPEYWARCQRLIAAMPSRVAVRHLGTVPPHAVVPTLAGYDLMLLPTAGENYGHAIVDSLLAGTPVLVSDRTPWHGLAEAGAGADLPLEDKAAWLDWIRRFASLGAPELSERRAQARAYVERALASGGDGAAVERSLFAAMGKSPRLQGLAP